MRALLCLSVFAIVLFSCGVEKSADRPFADSTFYQEAHRPQFHFSPREKWMNDPNGMVFHNGEYHLFYQYYPEGLVWGPMHWGHAVSKDMIRWEHLPIALYPDSLGLIFSGSVVVDKNNTSGFGSKENPALVAVFTYHSMEKEKAGRTDYQYQGIAFSNDNGREWTKYDGNPVLGNQGVKDFRDPKVFWHQPSNKWVMALAVKDHVELWQSANLKSWDKLSDFGFDYGDHGGVWECPDLFQVEVEGSKLRKWILIVSINPGGPNGGSATQYFVGDFDGKTFTSETKKTDTLWLDYGPDNYAGVTWSNMPDDRSTFFGWMSNWAYAQEVPTAPWRSANTIPRELSLKNVNGQLHLKSSPSPEVQALVTKNTPTTDLSIQDSLEVADAGFNFNMTMISGVVDKKDFSLEFFNDKNEFIAIGYDSRQNRFFIDRTHSGKTDFSKNYPLEVYAPRISNENSISFTVVKDVSSVEVFFDDGVSVMTSLFFPTEDLTRLKVRSNGNVVRKFEAKQLGAIWR
jgi:fructan beta-fructosidase